MCRMLTAVAVLVAAVMASAFVGAATSSVDIEKRVGTIAFLRYPPGSWKRDVGGPRIFAIEANGTGLRPLTQRGFSVGGYRWSPDGSLIAYTSRRGSLWVMRRNGSERQLLVPSSRLRVLATTWSPDRSAIGVLAQDPAVKPPWPSRPRIAEIYVVPTEGGEPRLLPTGDVRNPEWSPQRGEIAYSSSGGQVWIIRSDGTDARLVLRQPGLFVSGWSPDGTRLVFEHGNSRRGRYSAISVAKADGTDLHLVTNHAYNEYGEAWSPDGRRILYGRENREGISVIDASGRNDHRVTRDSPPPDSWEALTWSPDGRSIAYYTDRTGGGDIYAIDADGHKKVRLTSSSAIDVAPSWAPR
jgi:Tol biopolymer transport system component